MLRLPNLPKGRRLAALGLATMAIAAIAIQWRSSLHAVWHGGEAERQLMVTHTGDDGAGSLREAIFSAAEFPGTIRIQLPPERLTLRSPLPPLTSRAEIVLEGVPGKSEIDASAAGAGPILDFDVPEALLKDILIRNAAGPAVLVRQGKFSSLRNAFVNCDQGLHALGTTSRLTVRDTVFEANRVGLFLGSALPAARIEQSRFVKHTDAAIWAVNAPQSGTLLPQHLSIHGNQFEGDRIALVLGNVASSVEGNEMVNSSEYAIYLLGQGGVVRKNRIRAGKGVGVFADNSSGILIDSNEIDHNQIMGVLIRSSADTLVRGNRVYGNGYGIAFVFAQGGAPNRGSANLLLQQKLDGIVAVGSSPILEGNRVLGSNHAAFRLLDYESPSGARAASRPLLHRNVFDGTRENEIVRGTYPERPPGKGPQP
jgi:parallel beta-helix repeat protein